MGLSSAIALLVLLSHPASGVPAPGTDPEKVCQGERSRCRGACGLDYGSSVEWRPKLDSCLAGCDERQDLCLLRFLAQFEGQGRPPERRYLPAPTGPKDGMPPRSAPVRRESTRANELPDPDSGSAPTR